MKVHYINYINILLLFALPLNILVNTHKRPHITPRHTQKIATTRLLFECELYAPVNYDNDPQMKSVMQQFEDRTSQLLRDYDERMKEKRMQCKDRCDKEIQKIILKDKIDKELMDKFATLQTDIQSDAIPTCICEKSIADKVEKGCLRCGGILGSAVPELGAIGGSLLNALNTWQTKAINAAMEAVVTKATKAATQAGVRAVKLEIKLWSKDFITDGFVDFTSVVKESTFDNGPILHKSAMKLLNESCNFGERGSKNAFCRTILYGEDTTFKPFAEAGSAAFEKSLPLQKEAFEKANLAAVDATYVSNQISIIAPIIAIVVIVLIMVIIYLILRRRRKKKMKKKLQYIKLLEE
ncbi:PIR protein, putative [Plasmodium sp. DRC-Itaito]|nr:PIR protein, putative [Plasmodium sp. DRC-Itaito]